MKWHPCPSAKTRHFLSFPRFLPPLPGACRSKANTREELRGGQIQRNKWTLMNLTWLHSSEWAKVGPQSGRKSGILYTNPSIDPDQAPAESSGRWEQSPFDQTVVMTSSRSSNLPLKAGNSAVLPHGIMSQCVNYAMHAELFRGGIWPFQLQSTSDAEANSGSGLLLKSGQWRLHAFCKCVFTQVNTKKLRLKFTLQLMMKLQA